MNMCADADIITCKHLGEYVHMGFLCKCSCMGAGTSV